jgi:UDP-MurNAc hydroxylase
MRITYLGHAGFCVETSEVVVVIDPWLSSSGAYDSAWFQYPRNHHLATSVADKLSDTTRARFLYVSHEHQDHLDLDFLRALPVRDFTVVVPRFRRTTLEHTLGSLGPSRVVVCDDDEVVDVPGGSLRLYVDDSLVDRDSAILVELGSHRFLNLNDCKLLDRLSEIASTVPQVDVFSCQFSGATWHPTCYAYPPDVYEAISAKKVLDKYEGIAQGIEVVAPTFFLPAAGPPCFLDPRLAHLNEERVNIFPRAHAFSDFLTTRLSGLPTEVPELMPGDVLDVEVGAFTYRAPQRVDDGDFARYVHDYASANREHILEQQHLPAGRTPEGVLCSIRQTMRARVRAFGGGALIEGALYVGVDELPDRWVRVDFAAETVEQVPKVRDEPYMSLLCPAWQIDRLLAGHLTWQDFALTFRMRLDRAPDVYQPALHGFLLVETDDLAALREALLAARGERDRIVVDATGCRYEVDRYCPHQGGDLSSAWVEEGELLTCPRHRWQFALEDGGRCVTAHASVHAVRCDPAD